MKYLFIISIIVIFVDSIENKNQNCCLILKNKMSFYFDKYYYKFNESVNCSSLLDESNLDKIDAILAISQSCNKIFKGLLN